MKLLRMTLASLVLAFFCLTPAYADTMTARNEEGDMVRLSDSPCANETILDLVRKQFNAQGQPAPALQAGQADLVKSGKHDVCWILAPSLNVIVIYEDGAVGVIPLVLFAPDAKMEGI